MASKGTSFALIVVSCLGFAAAGEAADVSIKQGEVLIGRGDGFTPINASSGLLPGDVVIAKAGATANVSFSDGCNVALEPGAIVRVGLASPCKLHGPQPMRVTDMPAKGPGHGHGGPSRPDNKWPHHKWPEPGLGGGGWGHGASP